MKRILGNERVVFCAFLDILGFSQLIAHWDGALARYDAFMTGLGPALLGSHTTIGTLVRKATGYAKGSPPFFQYSFISDSIVVRASDAFDLLASVSQLYQAFLELGCPIRGGVGHGRHVEQNSKGNFFVVSEALVEAYHIEASKARFPRVVLSRSALDALLEQKGVVKWPATSYSKVHLNHTWASYLIQCEDDEWCLNPLYWPHNEEAQVALKHRIEGWLVEYAGRPIHSKYVWLADIWNHTNYGPRWLREQTGVQSEAIDTGSDAEHRFVFMSVMKDGLNNPIYTMSFEENQEVYGRILRRS